MLIFFNKAEGSIPKFSNVFIFSVFIIAFLNTRTAFAEPVRCSALAELLPSQTWYNRETNNTHTFKGSRFSGKRTIAENYNANYRLIERKIVLKDEKDFSENICLMSFTFLNGDCAGDVHTYVVELIGDGLRFKQWFHSSRGTWSFKDESSEISCTADTFLILPRH